MSRTIYLPSLLVFALSVTACGDDGGGSPDARATDANLATDASVTDAGPDASNGPDAMVVQPDAMSIAHGIDVARAAVDGVVDLAITEVLVTYLKPAIGNDPVGFFVQGNGATGPALFIAVDPVSLTTPVAVGDIVSFTITEMGTTGELRQALAITTDVVISSGNALTGIIQDVSAAADLVTNIGDYESEIVTAQFTVTESFTGAGTGFQAGVIETSAITAEPNLRLRLPITLQTTVGLVPTCTVTLSPTPVWRFTTALQLSAFELSEIAASCPPPVSVAAIALSVTEVTIEFDRAIDPANLVADGSQFTFDNGLVASAATVNGRVVTITTGDMGNAVLYTATIANTLLDVLGAAVTAPNNTAMYTSLAVDEVICDDGLDDDLDGFIDCQDATCAATAPCTFLSQLYLWEVDADTAGVDALEFVELWNNTNATIDLAADGYYLVLVNGSDDLSYNAVALSGTVTADGLFVAGADDAGIAPNQVIGNIMQNGADGVLLVQCATCTDAGVDFPNDTDVSTNATFTTLTGQLVTKIDALAYDTNDGDDTTLWTFLGVAAQFNEGANDGAIESNNRTSLNGWNALLANPQVSGVE